MIKASDNERDTGRLEAFSDGVMAVAITLLILDIHVPGFVPGHDLLGLLLSNVVGYLGYITSFIVIGLFWANHHYMFKYIKQTDHFLLLLNTLTLMCLVFIPFATSLLVEHFSDSYSYTAAMIYTGSLLLTSIMYNVLWWYASAHHRLLDEDLPSDVIKMMTRRYLVSLPFYLLTLFIAKISVEATLVLYILISLFYALPVNHLPFGRWSSSGGGNEVVQLQSQPNEVVQPQTEEEEQLR